MGKRLTLQDLPLKTRQQLKASGQDLETGSHPEALFQLQVKQAGLPDPVKEHGFSRLTERKWRFDFAWPARMLAVEIEGLTHIKTGKNGKQQLGRHQTLKGYTEDCLKYNQAALEGWTVLHFTPQQVKSLYAIDFLKRYWYDEKQTQKQ